MNPIKNLIEAIDEIQNGEQTAGEDKPVEKKTMAFFKLDEDGWRIISDIPDFIVTINSTGDYDKDKEKAYAIAKEAGAVDLGWRSYKQQYTLVEVEKQKAQALRLLKTLDRIENIMKTQEVGQYTKV